MNENNDKGELLWQMDRALGGPDEEYYVLISNKGVTAVLRPEYGGIDFYDIHGNCKTIIPFEDALGWGLRVYKGIWNAEGTLFAVSVTKHYVRSKIPEPWLILYDINGNEIWKSRLKGHLPHKILVSPSGYYIIIQVDGDVYLLNRGTHIMHKMPGIGDSRMRVTFSSNENKFAMFIPKDSTLYLIESAAGEILWTKKINLRRFIKRYDVYF